MRSYILAFKIFTPLILFILLFSSQNIFAQSAWQWRNPLPQGKTLNDCQYISSSIIIAVGNSGTIIKSTNNGVNWIILVSNTLSDLYRMNFIDINTGYISGDKGIILKTTNSGLNWINVNYTGYFLDHLKSLAFINATTGIVVGWNHTIIKTTNGGLNWINLNTTLGGHNWEGVNCIDENNITIVSEGTIFRSTDGGTTWQDQSPSFYTSNNFDVTYLNSSTGFVAGDKILKTTNGGIEWISKGIYGGKRIKFINSDIGYCIVSGTIMKTIDGGENWVSMPSLNIESINGVAAFSNNLSIAVGLNGLISKSNNLFTWTKISFSISTNSLSKMSILGDSTLVVGGSGGEILRSVNSGESWSKITSGISDNIVSLNFINLMTGFAGAGLYYPAHPPISPPYYSSKILKTTNGGVNWNIIFSSEAATMTSAYFLNENTGFFCTKYSSNKVYRTHDGGNNWIQILDGGSTYYSGIYFINSNTGFIYSSGYLTKRTTDGGENWLDLVIPLSSGVSKMQFLNDSCGFLVGSTSSVMYTSNAGLIWEQRASGISTSLHFFNVNTGYVIDNLGKLSYTTDNGVNWSTMASIPSMKDILFTSDQKGFIIGDGGMILSTTTGGFPISIVNLSNTLPDKFSLHQNYPNPFNPATKINFDLKNSAFAMLRIYDITGREVRTLVNEKLSAGSYSYDFNANELPSGVYFYQLQTDGFIETKKMILLK